MFTCLYLRTLPIVLCNGFNNLHSCQYRKVPFSPPPHQHLLFVDFFFFFWMIVIFTRVKWSLIVSLICISLIICYAKHLFMCFMVFCMSCLEKHLFRFSAHFLIGFFFSVELQELLVYFCRRVPYWSFHLQVFSPILRIFFFNCFLCCTKALSFIRFHLFVFVFIFITLRDGSKKYSCDLHQCVLCMFCFKSFIVSSLTFGSLIHLEFIFAYDVAVF